MYSIRQLIINAVFTGIVIMTLLGELVGLSVMPGQLQSLALFEEVVSLAIQETTSQNIQQSPGLAPICDVASALPANTAAADGEDVEVFIPLVIGAGEAEQETFYVATNGNDSTGDGSAATPWRTIDYALEAVPDGALILVKPGTYIGTVHYERLASLGITLRSEVPYKARLQNDTHALQIYLGRNLAVEGFDISHTGPGADPYVIQIQDLSGVHQCGAYIVLRNNFIHDSYNNDLVKVNNNASHVLIEGNIFYNMGGPETDSHLDINSVDYVTIQDNIFFNDYEGSGRVNTNFSGHFIVIKDSNGNEDGHLGSNDITIRRNIFLNWQGTVGNSFIGLGDGTYVTFFQARDILIENNLMLGNSVHPMHSALKSINAKEVVFRNNTIVGNLPANTYFLRTEVENPVITNDDFEIYNNIWSDTTGTMGVQVSGDETDFTISPPDTLDDFSLATNLYWNGRNPVPTDSGDLVKYPVDSNPLVANPKLPNIPSYVLLPRLNPSTGLIGGQFYTIRDAFIYLVQTYGTPALDSPAIGYADPLQAPLDDILGVPRGGDPDLGAVEVQE